MKKELTLGKDLPDTTDIFGLPIDPNGPYEIKEWKGFRYVQRSGHEPSPARLQEMQRKGLLSTRGVRRDSGGDDHNRQVEEPGTV